MKDDSFGDMDNLPETEVLAKEIIANLEDALESFRVVENSLSKKQPSGL